MCPPPACNTEIHAEAKGPRSTAPGQCTGAELASCTQKQSAVQKVPPSLRDLAGFSLQKQAWPSHRHEPQFAHLPLAECFTCLQATCILRPVRPTGKGPKAWFLVSSHLTLLYTLEQTTQSLGFLVSTMRAILTALPGRKGSEIPGVMSAVSRAINTPRRLVKPISIKSVACMWSF